MKNIVINMNSDYFFYCLVMLNSLFFNNPKTEFAIYLLYSDVKKTELGFLEQFIRSHDSHFVAIEVSPQRFDRFPMHNRWSVETYYRLLIAELLPDTVKRALYLDIDVIVNGRIDALYETNIDACYLAACADIQEGIDIRSLNLKWNRSMDTPYFNAGVMLLNLPMIRKNITFDSFVEAAGKCGNELPYMDQDILNYTMGSHAYIFDNDIYNHVVVSSGDMGHALIFHYGTPNKPWKMKKDEAYYQMWWKYSKIDGLNNYLKEKMADV